MDSLLKINDIHTYFYSKRGVIKAVEGVTLEIKKGEILGIVGESGSGKSVAVKSIMHLVKNPGKIAKGEIIFEGENIANKTKKEMYDIRGNKIAMIFQEPMTSLNPALKIRKQLTESMIYHMKISAREAEKRAVGFLKSVKINEPEEMLNKYPHQLSGGMRQRVMIAMALSCNPSLLLADEPTTALDVTIQAQIIRLLKELRKKHDMSIIFITHDMGVINEISDNTAVMYCGRIMEYGTTYSIMKDPWHPYTKSLLKAIPKIDVEKEMLDTIPGNVPGLLNLPEGCKFSDRCVECKDICREKEPDILSEISGRQVRCWKFQ